VSGNLWHISCKR